MFHEQIAQITADHLRTHIADYLAEINAQFAASKQVKLIVPKSIDVTSVVGGMFTKYDEILPQYGIDILGKAFSPSAEDLYSYMYTGQINGLVHGTSEDFVDKLVHRHGAAVELFVRRHLNLHQVPDPNGLEFTILEFLFSEMQWSGTEDIGEVEGKPTWVAGFSCDVVWLVSENGPGQHASP